MTLFKIGTGDPGIVELDYLTLHKRLNEVSSLLPAKDTKGHFQPEREDKHIRKKDKRTHASLNLII